MSVELVIRPEAEADAVQAFRWYNEQVPGLGQEFLEDVDHAIEIVRENLSIGVPAGRGLRESLLRRFPFNIVYVERDEEIVIVGGAHQCGRPGYWHRRR